MDALSPADVQAALHAAGLEIQVMFMEESSATAPLAAALLGTELGSIVKSLLFMADDQAVLVLTAGDQKVHDGKLAAHFKIPRKKVRIATPDECLAIAGYAPGGVPPLGHRRRDFKILIDQTLSRYETVYAAAGAANTLFPIPYQTLVKVTGGEVVEVVKEAAS
jgi:prolyl-tRNA editing enzyme YbaK/EbsC (Cys-tRNA(Pro) deacylase)